eukprot:4924138-Amphidinium_carterae.1
MKESENGGRLHRRPRCQTQNGILEWSMFAGSAREGRSEPSAVDSGRQCGAASQRPVFLVSLDL